MTQTVSAIAVLGPGLTGLALGYRVQNLDATVYSAFTVVDVAETAVAGTYRVANGVIVPDAGGYIVFGTALVDYAEAPVDRRGLIQADILSDATPFAGANIDAAISSRAVAGDAMTLTAGERTTVAGVFLTQLLEGVHTVGDGLRIMLAALAGRSTGGGTFTNRFRDVADSKNRIDATVDANGNRNAITIDGT